MKYPTSKLCSAADCSPARLFNNKNFADYVSTIFGAGTMCLKPENIDTARNVGTRLVFEIPGHELIGPASANFLKFLIVYEIAREIVNAKENVQRFVVGGVDIEGEVCGIAD